MLRDADAEGALRLSDAIRKRLTAALMDALTAPDIAPIVARAPNITEDAIDKFWISYKAAVLLDEPEQLPAKLDRMDALRRQLIALCTAGRASETLQ